MENDNFGDFMLAQSEYFRLKFGDCANLSESDIRDTSIEFRKLWKDNYDRTIQHKTQPTEGDTDR